MKRVIIAGMGPGSKSCITEEVKAAIDNAEIIKCIKKYIPFRFKVKVVLNKMGIFRLVRKMIGKG